MRSNKKKLLSVILGFMASISGTSAVMKDGKDTKSTNTEMISKSKKRNQEGPGLGRNVAELVFAVFAGNEIFSNLPVVKGFTYPLLRQMLSGYRVRRNVRGEFSRSNDASAINYGYMVLNESDCGWYHFSFINLAQFYSNGKLKENYLREITAKDVEDMKSQGNLSFSRILNVADIRLAMEDEDGNILNGDNTNSVINFLKSDDYTASDAADALSKMIEFVNIINSNKTNDDKADLINQQFDVLLGPPSNKSALWPVRILVKERKNAKGQMRKIFAEFQLKSLKEMKKDA